MPYTIEGPHIKPILPKSPPIAGMYRTLYGVLGLYLTNKCNIKCAHCCTNSSPHSSTLLDVKKVLKNLSGACDTNPISALHVSGGEPFLQPKLLEKIGKVAVSKGLSYAINTNAFWGRSSLQATKTIMNIPGLTQLIISSDDYHEEFLPVERVIYAAIAGIESGIHVQICFCTPYGKKTKQVKQTLDLLPKDIRQKISVAVTPVELGGRANQLVEAHWRKLVTEFPEGSCSLLYRPVILENGTVQACCNTPLQKQLNGTPLHIGNISNQNLSTILSTGKKDPLLKALRLLGPAFLVNLLSNKQKLQFISPMPKDDICSLCTQLTSNKTVLKELYRRLDEKEIKRMLYCAEAIISKKNK